LSLFLAWKDGSFMHPLHLATLLLVTAPTTRAPADSVPLYHDLGDHHHEITTRTPGAQQYFDQGLRLVFGFNHGEAIRAFNQGARLDPDCAMCYWGTALAYGPHVNAPMDSAGGVAAYAAVRQALAHLSQASPREQAYIRAVAKRYAPVPPANRAPLDSAYAAAMGKVVRTYPDDLDAATLYAEALMDLRPWDYWKQPSGEPYPGTLELVAQLERVLRSNPNHPGACHYYIHAVEAVQPEKAVACAERLASLMPGDGHMVHMPAHIYIRVGRYTDAIESNVHAVHTDEAYIEDQRPVGVYPLGYYPHNLHFLAFAATMAGRSTQAIEASRRLESKVDMQAARTIPMVQVFVPFLDLTLVTFGRWSDVLQQPLPPADLRYANAMAHYARGVAFSATNRWGDAQAELDRVKRAVTAATEEDKPVLNIALHALMGEMAARRGRLDEAIGQFQIAATAEDGMLYVEPPTWYYPIRHSLGATLLRAGRAAQAEAIYRQDLKRNPENGWSLFGLAAALRAQHRIPEAESVEERFRRAWATADVTLTASRL
jgi:tetratricopeptide (TPR) repeat protein